MTSRAEAWQEQPGGLLAELELLGVAAPAPPGSTSVAPVGEEPLFSPGAPAARTSLARADSSPPLSPTSEVASLVYTPGTPRGYASAASDEARPAADPDHTRRHTHTHHTRTHMHTNTRTHTHTHTLTRTRTPHAHAHAHAHAQAQRRHTRTRAAGAWAQFSVGVAHQRGRLHGRPCPG